MATESLPAQRAFQAFSDLDLGDEMSKLLPQAHAFIANTYGGSGEGFRGMDERHQDSYLFAVAEMLGRMEAIWDEIGERHRAKSTSALGAQSRPIPSTLRLASCNGRAASLGTSRKTRSTRMMCLSAKR